MANKQRGLAEPRIGVIVDWEEVRRGRSALRSRRSHDRIFLHSTEFIGLKQQNGLAPISVRSPCGYGRFWKVPGVISIMHDRAGAS